MRRLNALLAGIALAAASTAALAGFTQPAEVDVIPNVSPDPAGGLAQGDMTSARYDKDPDVYIGCGIRKFITGGGAVVSTGFCQARDAADQQIVCTTTNADLLDAISSSGDFGFVTFSWNGAGTEAEAAECRRIGFSNQSLYLPKKLDRN
ncbi:MAG: hypothetical protein ABL957_01400 [Parvularculaceae bacterium]